MPSPDFQTLMLPVLESAADGEVAVRDVIVQLSDRFGLTPEERRQRIPSGRAPAMGNRVGWAKTYLKKARLIESTGHGLYRITDRGRKVLAEKPEKINLAYLSRFEEIREFRSSTGTTDGESSESSKADDHADEATPDEILRTTHERIENALAAEVLDRVLGSAFDFFEKLVVDLLVRMGYGGSRENAGRRIGRSGDEGIDGVIDEDALGLDQIYIQAKRYKPEHSIDASTIREFIGSLEGVNASKGVFVTTSSFTQPAKDFAQKVAHRVILIDGEQLARLMVRHNVGVRVEDVLEVKRIDEDFFTEE